MVRNFQFLSYRALTGDPSATNCDSCDARAVPRPDGTTPFSPSRYLCIDCSDEEVDHSIDLCADCFDGSKSASRGDVVHSPASHNVLQLRTTRLRVYRYTLLSTGTGAARRASALVDSSSGSGPGLHAPTGTLWKEKGRGAFCAECKEQVKERPFWYCIDCRGKPILSNLFDRSMSESDCCAYHRFYIRVLRMQQAGGEGETVACAVVCAGR